MVRPRNLIFPVFILHCLGAIIISGHNYMFAPRLTRICHYMIILVLPISIYEFYSLRSIVGYGAFIFTVTTSIVFILKLSSLVSYKQNLSRKPFASLTAMNPTQTLRNLLTPWCLFQDFCKEYPSRRVAISRQMIIRCLVELAISSCVILASTKLIIVPLCAHNKFIPNVSNFSNYAIKMLRLNAVVFPWFLIIFYSLYQTVCRMICELFACPDMKIFDDWWNSETLAEFWATWNLSVHRYLSQIYRWLSNSNFMSRKSALLLTYCLSGALHELAMVIMFGKLKFPLFATFFTVQIIPDTLLSRLRLKNRVLNRMILSVLVVNSLSTFTYYYSRL